MPSCHSTPLHTGHALSSTLAIKGFLKHKGVQYRCTRLHIVWFHSICVDRTRGEIHFFILFYEYVMRFTWFQNLHLFCRWMDMSSCRSASFFTNTSLWLNPWDWRFLLNMEVLCVLNATFFCVNHVDHTNHLTNMHFGMLWHGLVWWGMGDLCGMMTLLFPQHWKSRALRMWGNLLCKGTCGMTFFCASSHLKKTSTHNISWTSNQGFCLITRWYS